MTAKILSFTPKLPPRQKPPPRPSRGLSFTMRAEKFAEAVEQCLTEPDHRPDDDQ